MGSNPAQGSQLFSLQITDYSGCMYVYTYVKCIFTCIMSFFFCVPGCHLFVSDSGEQALLVTSKLDLHLWELREGLYSEWWQLPAPDDLRFPREDTRQVAIDANFYVHQV